MAAPCRKGKFVEVFPKICGSRKNQMPTGRSGHCCVVDESNLYVYGGYNPSDSQGQDGGFNLLMSGAVTPSRQVLSELWIFNFASRIWRRILTPDIPKSAASACMRLKDGKLFVYGGTEYPFGHVMSNRLTVCYMENNYHWEQIPTRGLSEEFPPQAYGQSLVFHENTKSIYVFAGAISFYNEPMSELHRLDLETLKWEHLRPQGDLPKGRYKQEVALWKDRMFVFGGGHLLGGVSLGQINMYSFSANAWSLIDTVPDPAHAYPKPRSCFGIIQNRNHIVISGGRFYDPSNLFESLGDFWNFNLDTLEWRCLEIELPEPSFFHGMTLTASGMVYLYGGLIGRDNRTSRIHRMQMFLSPLSELCWDVIVHAVEDIERVNKHILYDLGVPRRFVDRIS